MPRFYSTFWFALPESIFCQTCQLFSALFCHYIRQNYPEIRYVYFGDKREYCSLDSKNVHPSQSSLPAACSACRQSRQSYVECRGWGYLTKFEFRQTLTARSLLLVPLSVKTPLGRSTSRYFDRRQAYFDFRIQLKIKILTTLKIVRKFLTKIFLNIFWDEKSKYCINFSGFNNFLLQFQL